MKVWDTAWTHLKAGIKSIEVWVNGVMTSAAVLAPILADQVPSLQQYVPTNLFSKTMLALAVVNVVLHTRTAVKAQQGATSPGK